jgi:hypothetical protein
MFDALIATLQDTRLEPDLPDLLWSTVNLFHRAAVRVQHELDANEVAQKRSQKPRSPCSRAAPSPRSRTPDGRLLRARHKRPRRRAAEKGDDHLKRKSEYVRWAITLLESGRATTVPRHLKKMIFRTVIEEIIVRTDQDKKPLSW